MIKVIGRFHCHLKNGLGVSLFWRENAGEVAAGVLGAPLEGNLPIRFNFPAGGHNANIQVIVFGLYNTKDLKHFHNKQVA